MYALFIVLVIVELLVIFALMGKLRKRRYDGSLLVEDSDEKTTLALEIDTPPEKLVTQDSITLKVVKILE